MSFEEIYEEYKNMVYNLCLNYLQNTEDAEETTQDVFLKIHHKIDTFKADSSLKTWIYRITINQCLDVIKSKKRQRFSNYIRGLFSSENEYKIHSFSHPGIELEQKERLEKLFKLINELAENQKTALILSKLEQMSQKEVTQIMNLSEKAVESLIQRAKTNLLKKIESENEGK